ncbi:MAG: glycosyltransferase family 2 protein [Olsenella sp.]|jgi:glycosyltransferase involved in cell wall biosynthesis|nr:glycosyltransferase family 2 protein [Olsenella sp.]MDD6706353.1 glycosyltransferase family 2 protein [Olsenella sp.]
MQETAASPKVSVIIPCYKVEKYLPKCIASLVGQTLDNYELIFINDGSPDHCIDILKEWQSRYPDRIVIIDKRNEGVWRGRWDGIAKARGEYIGFLDSDDYAEPNFLQDLYDAAKGADADIAVCGFSRTDLATGKVLSREMCDERSPFKISEDPGRLLELNGAPWNKIFRASVLKSLEDLPTKPPVLDDLLFHWLAYLEMNDEVVFVPESLVNYMVRSDSIIQTVKPQQIEPTYEAFKEVKERYTAHNAPKGKQEALDAAAFLHLGISFNYRLAASPDCDLKATIEKCTEFLNKNFPTWHDSPYINGQYARLHGKTFKRLLTVSRFYKLGLLPAFLSVYSAVISHFGIDIKW